MRLREYLEIRDGLKSKLREGMDLEHYCDECDIGPFDDLNKTIYGKTLCDNCWDEYINSEAGLAEYVKGIAFGEYSIDDFTQSELNQMAKVWDEYKDVFDLTEAEIEEIEILAEKAGFIFLHTTSTDPTIQKYNLFKTQYKVVPLTKSMIREIVYYSDTPKNTVLPVNEALGLLNDYLVDEILEGKADTAVHFKDSKNNQEFVYAWFEDNGDYAISVIHVDHNTNKITTLAVKDFYKILEDAIMKSGKSVNTFGEILTTLVDIYG